MRAFDPPIYSKRTTTLDDAGLPKAQHTTFKFQSVDGQVYSVKIGYENNENIPGCIENQLLRTVQFKDSQTKNAYLGSYLSRILPWVPILYDTMTGIRLYTKDDGVVAHDIFEDISELPTLVDVQSLPPVLSVNRNEIFDLEPLTWCVSKGKYQNRTCILKEHIEPAQNQTFRAELEVYTCPTLRSSHIARFIGYTSDANAKVTGIVLEYYEGGNLKHLLRKTRERCSDDKKLKWAVQIVHALVALHKCGLTHGDLRCENIVMDREGNAKLIDIVRGWGYMDGWAPITEKDVASDPKWDIYSLGVTLWEMAGDSEDPGEDILNLERSMTSSKFWGTTSQIVKKCLVTDPEQRPSAAEILSELRVLESCGCEENLS